MKKKLLLSLLAVILSILPTFVNAATLINGIYYNLNSTRKTAEVTSMPSGYYTGAVNIPQTVKSGGVTYNVTSIGRSAFEDCNEMTSITIPKTVTNIGLDAFYDCDALTTVNISDLAAWCNVIFQGELTDGTSPFAHTDTKLYLNGTEIKDLVIPNSVTNIYDGPFSYCRQLTSITIPNSVTKIGESAFEGCSNVTSLTLGNSVTSIGEYAFYNCTNITAVHISDLAAWCNISFANETANPFYYANHLYVNGTEVKNLTIPNTVTSIGSSAFRGCTGLTSITIPNTVTSIGSSAFSGCTGLTSATIGNGVSNIKDGTFSGCSGLTSVTIGNGVTSITGNAFGDCSNLTSIVVAPDNTVYDSRNNCNAIIKTGTNSLVVGCKNTVIPNSVTSIGSYAFWDRSSLTSISIPNSVTSISYNAFSGCTGLTSITIPNSVTSIGSNAFRNCTGLTSITIPTSVISIDNRAFWGCTGLTSITIPNNVTTFGEYVFSGCTGLTSVTFQEGVSFISKGTFYGCSGLTSITIPNSVTSIGENAFENSGLTSVIIPGSIKYISHYLFRDCSSLTSVIIENGVEHIGIGSFSGCSSMVTVTLPASITQIYNNAFDNCNCLSAVIIEREHNIANDIYSNSFPGARNTNLFVPQGAKSGYQRADYWKEFKTIIEYPGNDVNRDGVTNVVDVVDIARTVIGTLADEVIRHMADQDNSNSVTVADAIVLVNEIAGNTNWAKPMMAMSRAAANDVLKLVSTDGNYLSLQMDGNGQYAAFQFDLWLPEGVDVIEMALNNERRQGHQLLYNKVSEGHYRVVALSTAANSFNGTSGELLDLTLDDSATDDIRVDDIRFVTPDGSERQFAALGVTRNGITTSIDGMNGDDNCDKRTVYNLNGQRMNSPQKGLNIINGRKVVIK